MRPTHPDPALPVFRHSVYRQSSHPSGNLDSTDTVSVYLEETVVCANPHNAMTVLKNAADEAIGQTLGGRVGLHRVVLEMEEPSTFRSRPQTAVPGSE